MRCTSDAARALCTARGQSAPCRRPHPRRDGAGQEPQTRASWHARCDGEGALQSIPHACSLLVPHTLSFTGSANLGDESDLERTKPNRGPPLPGNFCQIEETAFFGTVLRKQCRDAALRRGPRGPCRARRRRSVFPDLEVKMISISKSPCSFCIGYTRIIPKLATRSRGS